MRPPWKTTLWSILGRIFARFGADPPAGAVDWFQGMPCAEGLRLFEPGDAQDLVHVNAGGIVRTQFDGPRGPVIVQFVRPGWVFGLASGREPRQLGAVVHEPALVAIAGHGTGARLIRSLGPGARFGMVDHTLRVFGRLLFDKCVLLDRPLPARVEYTMRVLARAFPRPGEPGLVDLRLSRRHVAQLVGGSRAAVGRALARLEAEGRLSVRDGRFAIHGAGEPLRFGPRPPLGTVLPPDREPPAARPTLRRLLNRLRPALGLDERSVERIVSMARLVRCAPGERVPAAPEGAYLSFVVDGAVRIVRETLPELWVHVARPGQFAGIGAEARDGRRLFRAEAHVPSTVAILGREAFAEVIGATMDEEGLLQFLAYASRVLSSYIRDQCLFLTMTGDERLLHALGVLAADFPRPDERGVVVDLRFTQRQLGRLVGMRREKVCGALVRLRRAGLVDVVEGCILLRGQHTGRAA